MILVLLRGSQPDEFNVSTFLLLVRVWMNVEEFITTTGKVMQSKFHANPTLGVLALYMENYINKCLYIMNISKLYLTKH
jgi:hypothetical protein